MRLAELIIENYRGIGEPIRIKIDKIIVLIGNNNVGKSTIINAYEVFASMGLPLDIKDFYNEDKTKIPKITGIFVDISPNDEIAEKWIHDDEQLGYKRCIKAQYRWLSPGVRGEKYSYDPELGEFVPGGLGGFDSILASKIPVPIKISPLDDPSELQGRILEILIEAIKEKVKTDSTKVENLLKEIEKLAESVQKEVNDEIEKACKLVSDEINKVFPHINHVYIDAKSGKIDIEKLLNSGSFIRIGQKSVENQGKDTHMSPLVNHGTGLQRTFLWSAIKMLAETGRHKVKKKAIESEKAKILLIEEPEAFLHPSAIKEAREALYAIAELNNWQVMTSTHSPIFIDLTKDHTTIIRIEKNERTNHIVRTFRTDEANFNVDDRENLKMLNFCNPYFNEFFFSNNILLVEGETEYTAIKCIMERWGESTNDLQVINCFGKGNIVTVSKILNHFSVNYSILHDMDCPKVKRKEQFIVNSAWSYNKKKLSKKCIKV
jgi:putative ATP-dependent endonuclease of the OLD family